MMPAATPPVARERRQARPRERALAPSAPGNGAPGNGDSRPAYGLHSGGAAGTARRAFLAGMAGMASLSGLGTSALVHAQPVPAAPQRLITLGGSITETAYALDVQDQLVGVDETSTWPPAVQALPKVGYFAQLSAEGLLSLRPTAVLGTSLAGPPAVIAQLREAGVPVELIPVTHDWTEVARKVQAVGRICGQPARAQALHSTLAAQWQAAQAEVAAWRGVRPRVLFVLALSQAPRVAGRRTAADAMLRFSGAVNAMGDIVGYRELTAESVAQARPDVIATVDLSLERAGGADAFWQRPGLALTPAYRKRALVIMEPGEFLGFGPRMPQAVHTLHRKLAALAGVA